MDRGYGGVDEKAAALNHPRALAAALLSFEEEPPSGDHMNTVARRRLDHLGRFASAVDFSTYALRELVAMCSEKAAK